MDDKYGFIDKTGKQVIPCIYKASSIYFSEGLVGVETEQGWGYIDKQGNWAIKPYPEKIKKYQTTSSPSPNRAKTLALPALQQYQ